ncbi:MAG: TrmH family RNA methyltransferase [Candidatus Iainarchaeum sp.]|jgi:hypothetical protein|nr:MAG: tRNA guanosine-2'-O-methyltransferase [archaeon ADurb.Bin336]
MVKTSNSNEGTIFLFDSLKDPRDMAQIIHLGLALGLKIEFTGSSIQTNHPKVVGILNSWIKGFKEKPNFGNTSTHPDFFKRINFLKKEGYLIIGTTPNNNAIDLFEIDFSNKKQVIVFGTETTGLCKKKQELMDLMIKLPMNPPTSFFTISVIAPIICFETIRQKKHSKSTN